MPQHDPIPSPLPGWSVSLHKALQAERLTVKEQRRQLNTAQEENDALRIALRVIQQEENR